MRVLELFSGTQSVGKVCHKLNWEVISVDINDYKGNHTPTQISIGQLLESWKDKVSTIGLSNTLLEEEWIPDTILALKPRVCSLGEMQCPPFLRLHDGRTMWPQK